MAQTLPAAALAACERVCLSYRRWAPDEPRAPSLHGTIGDGESNHALVLAGTRASWVLRVPRSPSAHGVCRWRELAIHRHAAAAGLAPPVLYAEPAAGLLVTPLLPSAGSGSVAEAARLLRAIHALSPLDAAMRAPLDSVEHLALCRERLGGRDPLGRCPDHVTAALDAAARRITAATAPAVICHNDLLAANRHLVSGRLVAIDWEYARAGDPFFDLAVVAAEHPLETHPALLRAYLRQTPSAAQRRRLGDQLLLYLAIAACWYADSDTSPATVTAALRALDVAGSAALAVGTAP